MSGNVWTQANGAGVPLNKATFLCVKCNKTFVQFKGMKRRGSTGLGWCQEHTPQPKAGVDQAPKAGV